MSSLETPDTRFPRAVITEKGCCGVEFIDLDCCQLEIPLADKG